MNEAPIHFRHGHLTYAGLKDILNSLTQDQLKQTVTVYVTHEDYYPVLETSVSDENDDVLDEGHFYLKI